MPTARDLRIVTWVHDDEPRLAALDVETYMAGTATALEGVVLLPGLFQALESRESAALEEAVLRNPAFVNIPLYDLPLPGGVRVILLTRDGTLIIPEGETELQILDRVTLGGEPPAVREAFTLLSGRTLLDQPPPGPKTL